MADPSREVYAWVGDGTYLMNPTEIVTAVLERIKINIIVVNNHGFGSIGALSSSIGSEGFGTRYLQRDDDKENSQKIPFSIDFAQNAQSLGAVVFKASTLEEFNKALKKVKKLKTTTVIVVEADRNARVPGYESWWDVAIAEVSTMESVNKARREYEVKKKQERYFL